MRPRSAIPARYRILASLVPILAALTLLSTVMLLQGRAKHARLAWEKKRRERAVLPLERARELVDRSNKYSRRHPPDFMDVAGMLEEAVDQASEALSRFPDYEEAHRLRGQALEGLYNFEEARADYEDCLRLHPESPARFLLGVLGARELARARLTRLRTSLLERNALRDRAVEPLRRFQAPGKEWHAEIDTKFRTICGACIAYSLEEYAKVEVHANGASNMDETEWLPPYLRGLAFYALKKRDQALQEMDQAIQTAPAVADPYAWRGLMLHELERPAAAIEALSMALEADAHFLEAYFVRGTILFEDGRFSDAREDFEKCAKLRASLPDVHLKYGIASLRSWQGSGGAPGAHLDEAVRALTKFIELRPDDPAGYVHRGRARLVKGDPAGAEADLTSALARSPEALDALELRAEMYEARAEWTKAEEDATRLIEKAADRSRALHRRARIRARAGRLEASLADYDELLSRDPNNVGSWVEKGDLHLRAGRPDAARATAEEALERNRSPRLLLLRGEALLALGDANGALQDAGEAYRTDPQVAEPLVLRGKAWLAKGDKASARADFQKALELRPDLEDSLAGLLAATQ